MGAGGAVRVTVETAGEARAWVVMRRRRAGGRGFGNCILGGVELERR